MLGKLREKNVTHVYVVGLALDVCVAFTALHAAEEGFVTHVVTDACAGVTIEGINAKKDAFEKEVRLAMTAKMNLVLAHENVSYDKEDTERRYGVDSGVFFKITPQDLVDDGMYANITAYSQA